MGFISRKRISYKSLFYMILCLWLYGSDCVASSFKIYRNERDIFTNLKCSSDNCTESQCEMYGAECVSDDNCEYCRCSEDERNTFMISNYTSDPIHGGCKRNEEIVPESGNACTLIFTTGYRKANKSCHMKTCHRKLARL